MSSRFLSSTQGGGGGYKTSTSYHDFSSKVYRSSIRDTTGAGVSSSYCSITNRVLQQRNHNTHAVSQ